MDDRGTREQVVEHRRWNSWRWLFWFAGLISLSSRMHVLNGWTLPPRPLRSDVKFAAIGIVILFAIDYAMSRVLRDKT